MANTSQPRMDEAAGAAESELKDLPQESVAVVAAWWVKHFTSAGHKRLGRVLIKHHTKSNKEI